MITFPIKFTINEIDHTATVHRIGGGQIQYHIFDITPYLQLQYPLIFEANPVKQELEFGIPYGKEEEYNAIITAIFEGCRQNGYGIFK